MTARRARVWCGAIAAASSALLSAAGSARQQEAADIALSGELELTRLVELVSQRLGVSVQYQAADLAKKVTLRLRTALKDSELWDALVATLDGQGLAVIETDQPGLFRVVPAAQAAAQQSRLVMPDAPGALPAAHEGAVESSYLSTIVRLRSADPTDIVAALTPVLTPQTGVVKPIGAGGLLLLSDSRRRVEQALTLLELLDAPADPARTFTVELAHASATDVITLTQQVLAAKAAVDGRSGKTSQVSAALRTPGAPPVPGSVAPSGLPAHPQLIALPDDQRILAIVPASREDEVRELLLTFDTKEPSETRSYSTPSASPEDLAASVRALLDSRSLSGGAGGAKQPGARVYADRLTSAVVVTASAKDHERVQDLVDRVNAAPMSSRQTLRSFVIRSRSAVELVATLEGLLASGALGANSAAPGVAPGAERSGADSDGAASPQGGSSNSRQISPNRTGLSSSGVFTVPQSDTPGSAVIDSSQDRSGDAVSGAERAADRSQPLAGRRFDLSLSVDEATNTILAVGDPALLRQLEALIAELDRRQPQVMIEATIVSLSDTEALSFGAELRTQFQSGGTSFDLASLFGLASATGGPLAAGTGFSGIIINPGDYQIVVRALETLNEGRATSTPRVLVSNNATATLRGVLRQPFTSINASQTVATTSFGGTQDAGTTITVTPAIAEGDHLLLDYSVELSAFTGEPTTTAGGGIIPPPSQQNSVEGQATIPDGFTVVVGGLDNASRSKGASRVPLLGAIPILGALFGTQSESENSARFFVFLRATVLRDPGFEDLKRLSAPGLAAASVTGGMPRLEPRWVE